MNWNSISDFLAMGGYGAYVWGSFGVVFALVAIEVFAVGQRWRTVRQHVQRAHARKKVRA